VDPQKPLISVIVATRNRPVALRRCLESTLRQDYSRMEVLVLDDCSRNGDTGQVVTELGDDRVRYMRSAVQLGIGGSRNLLMEQAVGEYVVSLDDDAELLNPQALKIVEKYFQADELLAAIAFNVTIVTAERYVPQVPFRRRALRRSPELLHQPRLCSYFLGSGHALRKAAAERVQNYRTDSRWYLEDVDLSYRLIKARYHLLYAPAIRVSHYEESSVVTEEGQTNGEMYYTARHCLWFAYEHLPFPYAPFYALGWLSYHSIQAFRQRRSNDFYRGTRDGLLGLHTCSRQPLKGEALAYVRDNLGRLWY